VRTGHISLLPNPTTLLSLPNAIPPWGGAPHLKACSKWLNDAFSYSSSCSRISVSWKDNTASWRVAEVSPVTLPKICILASSRHALGRNLRQFRLRLGLGHSVGRVPGQSNSDGMGQKEPHECPYDVSDYGCIATHVNPHLRDASLVQGLYVLPHWRSEGVVRATPSTLCEEILFCVGTREQWKLSDPEKVRGTGWVIRPYTAARRLSEG
jgi:hypothetical protein